MTTYTIKDSGGGGDFTSINAFIGDGDTVADDIGSIEGTWDSDDAAAVTWNKDVVIVADADSKQAGRYWESGDTSYRHRVTSGHAFTVTAALDMTDVNVQSASTGSSNECFRFSSANDAIWRQCILGFVAENNQQDIIYPYNGTGTATFTLENCLFGFVDRGVVTLQGDGDATLTVNYNSCMGYDCGPNAQTNGSYLGSSNSGSGTVTVNALNSGLSSGGSALFAAGAGPTFNTNFNFSLSNISSGNISQGEDSEDLTGSGFSYIWTESANPGSGSKFGVIDLSPIDSELTDHALNDAIAFHATSSDAGLTIPATDILGRDRDTSTPEYDVGCYAFTLGAGGGTTHEEAATLAASANLAGLGELVTDQAAALGASLDVGAASDVSMDVAATLASSAQLAAANILTAETDATLASSGQLAALSQADYAAAVSIAASFQITGDAAAAFEAAATLAASANLAGLGELVTDQAATLGASFGASAGAIVSLEVIAVLASSANLTTLSQADRQAAATLAASGDMAALGELVTDQAATLAASMNLTAAAGLVADASATLAASSNVTATSEIGEITIEASAALGASLNLAAASNLIAEVDATLAASTNLAAAAELLAEVSASLAASVDLVSLGELEAIEVQAGLGASFQVSSSMDYIGEALAGLGFSADLTAANIATLLADAGIAFTGEITPITGLDTSADATLLWSVDIIGTGSTIVGTLVTPDSRKIVILADSRTVKVLEDTRTVIIH
jgi:hypothetical protein